MSNTMEDLTKVTTKQYYICGTCKEKMETISLGSTGDIFGSFSFSGSKGALYCNNNKCEKFGYLTVAGIKVEE